MSAPSSPNAPGSPETEPRISNVSNIEGPGVAVEEISPEEEAATPAEEKPAEQTRRVSLEAAGEKGTDGVPSDIQEHATAVNGTEIEATALPLIPKMPPLPPRRPAPPMPPRRHDPPKHLDPPLPEEKSAIEVPPEINLDSAAFSQDVNWEEKAWRELTRLREDMFLARIGSIRNTESAI